MRPRWGPRAGEVGGEGMKKFAFSPNRGVGGGPGSYICRQLLYTLIRNDKCRGFPIPPPSFYLDLFSWDNYKEI